MKCIRCKTKNVTEFKDVDYFDFITESNHLISGYQCNECGTIHSIENGKLKFFQYEKSTNESDKFKAVSNYATDQSVAFEKMGIV